MHEPAGARSIGPAGPLGLLLVALVLALVGGSGACGPPDYPPTLGHSLLDRPLPELTRWRTLGGGPAGEGLAGRVVVVKFFAEFCAPCTRTLPEIERLHRRLGDVAFVGVDEDDDEAAARALVTRHGLTFPVVHDRANALSGRFRVASLPMTFVVDPAGIVRWVGNEGATEADLERAIAAAAATR